MEVKIDFTKTPQENAGDYYSVAKKLAQKRAGIEKTISELEARLEKIPQTKGETEKKPLLKQKREWYEKFHWFFTGDGHLAIGGRDAKQNEQLNSKYFNNGDLFFHANVFGASVVVLKDGISSSDSSKAETAQFAASYSSAWKKGMNSVDVYAMERAQVSKSTGKGSLGTGSFLLSGERKWYRNTPLGLIAVNDSGKFKVFPDREANFVSASLRGAKIAEIKLGKTKKSYAAKMLAEMLGIEDVDEIMQQLPAGEFYISFL
ncbi:MAG: NFACT RNA binding domain-containing protein [Candidatus Micrarchaeaceae archaeon]